ncbi:MAG: ABC transporter permease subunit, partial [Kofleriaceae bacterium]
VSKPIERWEFVAGKYLGMALVLSVLVALFGLAMIGMLVFQGSGVSSAVFKALVLSWFEVLTVAAIAIFFSSFSTPFLSGIFALVMWGLGRVTPDIQAAIANGSAWIKATARLALEIVPDLHLFSPSGRLVEGATVTVHGDFITWGYVGLSSLHALGWIAGLLAIACLLFQRRDFA